MFLRALKLPLPKLVLVCGVLLPAVALAQRPPVVSRSGKNPDGSTALPGVVPR
jgi:hypothetical protein